MKKDFIDEYKLLLIHYHRKCDCPSPLNIRDCLDRKIVSKIPPGLARSHNFIALSTKRRGYRPAQTADTPITSILIPNFRSPVILNILY
jgi:hypothetical protein